MVRHILKKDWLLLWPFVAALTTLQALIAWARFTAGPPPNTVPSVPAAFLESSVPIAPGPTRTSTMLPTHMSAPWRRQFAGPNTSSAA